MTIQLASWALDQATDGPLDKLLLLLVAEAAQAGDWLSFPEEYLARKADTSRAYIGPALQRLRARGLIHTHVGGMSGRCGVMIPINVERDINGDSLRARCLRAFNVTCAYCGKPGRIDVGPDAAPWSLDRIVPGNQGGRYVAENVVLSCGTCNSRKHTNPAPAGTKSLSDLEAGR